VLRSLQRFAHHLAGRRRALAALFGLGLAGSAVSLSMPLLGKTFVDIVAGRGDFATIPWLAAALVVLALLDFALGTWSGRVHARLSADVLAALRATLFRHCVEAPLAAIEPYRHGDLLTRFGTDVPRIQTLLVDGILSSLQNVLFLIVAAAITFSLSPVLALWSFVGLVLALAATTAFRRPIERRTRQVREAMTDLSHFLSERLGALRAIRLLRTAREDEGRLAGANARLNREVVAFQMLDAMAAGVPGLLLALALAWIYVVGGALLEAGTISLGTFVAFVLYQGRLFEPARGLLGLVRNLQEARVSVERVEELLLADDYRAPPPVRSSSVPAEGAIVLRDVTFAYPHKPPVFSGVNLRIATGERVALFGASGQGKSTLVHILFGLRRPRTGTAWIAGRPADEWEVQRATIGYAGAEPFLLHGSVEENLRYGNPGASLQAIQTAAALAAADGFIAALPDGYATIIGDRGLALSDGQRQRLGLARLFLRRPGIIVLDEAFSALDVETELFVRANLWRAFGDCTALMISHRPLDLEAFDRILVLSDGCFRDGTASELRAFGQRGAARSVLATELTTTVDA
jgi:ABC-type bacteriocin/lantibiotic exporter with double-glycine peptidase domain